MRQVAARSWKTKLRSVIRVALVVVVVSFSLGEPIHITRAPVNFGSWNARAPRPGSAQEGLGAAAVGTTVYALGGDVESTRNDGYDTFTDTWTVKAPVPTGRVEPAGVISVGGLVYVISGGCRVTCPDQMTALVEAYDPSTDSWSVKAPIPTSRSRSGVVEFNGKIYVIGGYVLFPTSSVPLNVVEAYDIALNTWTPLAPMPTAREGLLAAVIGGQIYAIGGLTTPRVPSSATSIIEVYDPIGNTWSPGFSSLPTTRGITMGGVLCGDTALVIGGANGAGVLNTNEAHEPPITWITHPPMPTARAEGGSAIVGNTIYVVGGFTVSPGVGRTNVNEAYSVTCGGDFNISASPGSLTLLEGWTGSSTITLTSLSGFSRPVSLTADGSHPFGVGVNPTTNKVYVSDRSFDTVYVIDVDHIVATVKVGSVPTAIAVNPDTNRIYVTNFGLNTVSVIDGLSNVLVTTIEVGDLPFGVGTIGVNSATNRIYVANQGLNAVSVIDGFTNTVVENVGVGNPPTGIGVNSVTNRIYVADAGSAVSVIDGATNMVVANVGVGSFPVGVGVNTVTNRIYVANQLSNTVSVIDGAIDTVVANVGVGSQPSGVGVNSVTNRIYVTNLQSNTVSVIDGSSDTVAFTVAVGGLPIGVGVLPPGSIYVANQLPTPDLNSNTISVIVGAGVALTIEFFPPTVVVNPATVTLAPGGTGASTLSISIDPFGNTPLGTYAITVQGSNGSLSHSVTVVVSVVKAGGGGSRWAM